MSTPTASSPAPAPPVGALLNSPPALVACVDDQPIVGSTFAHWALVGENEARAEHTHASEHDIVHEVMSFLIATDWTIGEASHLEVRVSAANVRRRFESLKRAQFPHGHGFRAFLKQTGETVADLLLRVKAQLLAQRIEQHVLAHHHGRHARARALARFAAGFARRWKAKTWCAAAYAVPGCGHTATGV